MSIFTVGLIDPFSESPVIHLEGIQEMKPAASGASAPMVKDLKPRSALTGVVTGVAVPLIVNPVDKYNTQVMSGAHKAGMIALKEAFKKNPYSGLSTSIASNVVKFGALLGARDASEKALETTGASPAVTSVVSAVAGGVAETLATAPISYVKTQQYAGKKFSEVMKAIPKGKVISTLFAGSSPMIGRNITFAAICFPLVPVIESQIRKTGLVAEESPVAAVAAGAISGSIATIVANPFTVVGTQMKANFAAASAVERAKSLVAKEGPGALLKGARVAVPRMGLVSAITSVVDHSLKKIEAGSVGGGSSLEKEVIVDFPKILDLPFGS